MDQKTLNELSSQTINKTEHQVPKHKARAHKPVHHARQVKKSLSNSESAEKPKMTTSEQTSSIRLSQSSIDKLHALQTVTGDRSRTALIERILPIVRPVLLSSKAKERKFKRNLKLIQKQRKFMAEMKKKL